MRQAFVCKGVVHISDVVHSVLEQFGFWNGINKTGIL